MTAERAALDIAETLQTAHINRRPDPAYDVNPSTAASQKVPVKYHPSARHAATADGPAHSSHSSSPPPPFPTSDEVPIEFLEPRPRKPNLPPLPDLRFEQSYLARMKPYTDAGDYKRVALYTFWDHVFMPLAQGMVWRLVVFGWRSFNTGAQFQGRGFGAKVRRWWWGVNGWKMPPPRCGRDDVGEFVVNQFGSAGAD